MTTLTLPKRTIWERVGSGRWGNECCLGTFFLHKLPFSKIILWRSTTKYKICIIKIAIRGNQLLTPSWRVPWIRTRLLQVYSPSWISTQLTFIRGNSSVSRYLSNQNFPTAQDEIFVPALESLRSISQACLTRANKGLLYLPSERHIFLDGSLT